MGDASMDGDDAEEREETQGPQNRPAKGRRRIAGVEKDKRRHQSRRDGEQCQPGNAPLQRHAAPGSHNPNFSMRRYNDERLMPRSSAAATVSPP